VDVDAALDELYAQSLENFTAERNAISAAAKKAGDADAARAIKQLKKPSVGAWTINQVVRRHPDVVAALFEVRDRLEKADSPKALRDLSRRRRELVAEITALAKDVLEDSPHGVSHATLEKVSQGLLAGGTDEERHLLERGILTREPSSSGLEAFGFASAASDVEESPGPQVSLKIQREVQKLRREAERLQQEAARLEQEASFAEEQARRARDPADRAARTAVQAETTAYRAAAELDVPQ